MARRTVTSSVSETVISSLNTINVVANTATDSVVAVSKLVGVANLKADALYQTELLKHKAVLLTMRDDVKTEFAMNYAQKRTDLAKQLESNATLANQYDAALKIFDSVEA